VIELLLRDHADQSGVAFQRAGLTLPDLRQPSFCAMPFLSPAEDRSELQLGISHELPDLLRRRIPKQRDEFRCIERLAGLDAVVPRIVGGELDVECVGELVRAALRRRRRVRERVGSYEAEARPNAEQQPPNRVQ